MTGLYVGGRFVQPGEGYEHRGSRFIVRGMEGGKVVIRRPGAVIEKVEPIKAIRWIRESTRID